MKLQKTFHDIDFRNLFTPLQDDLDVESTDPTKFYETTKPHVPDWYAHMVESPKQYRGIKTGPYGGVSNKALHSVRDEIVMAKPYHRGSTGLFGWTSVVVPKMFQAAHEGHLCDQVGVHPNDGRPITVHKFDTTAKTNYDAVNDAREGGPMWTPHRQDFAKIAMMDFLTDQRDRHSGNVMLRDIKGTHYPMAIDNERAFLYHQMTHDGPIEESSLAMHWAPNRHWAAVLGQAANTWDKDLDFTDIRPLQNWWKSSKDKIRQALVEHLDQVKDEKTRQFILSNFDARSKALSSGMEKWTAFGSNPFLDHHATAAPLIARSQAQEETRPPEEREAHELNQDELEQQLDIAKQNAIQLLNDPRKIGHPDIKKWIHRRDDLENEIRARERMMAETEQLGSGK